MTKRLSREEQERQRKDEDLRLMSDPKTWPQWPFLPLKRHVNGKHEVGVLYADAIDGKPMTFMPGQNLFALFDRDPQQLINGAVKKSPQELLDDGWEVD